MTLRITESELIKDVRAVLVQVERGNKVLIERGNLRPVMIMTQAQPAGRSIGECIVRAKAYEAQLGYAPFPDKDFAKDVEEGINARRETILSVWDD